MEWFIILGLFFVFLNILFVLYLAKKIKKIKVEEEKIKEVSEAIQEGARAFLKREFRAMIPIMLLVGLILGLVQKLWQAPFIFLFGAAVSSLAGYVGMTISTLSNSRVASRAQKSFSESFKIAISGGEVMGFLVVGLGLFGVIIIWLLFKNPTLLINYAFGASFVALFMRVGGGIYTKSADVGADIVGKAELNIPEDDPRNPATIADNVGDNVGDIAGMGADLFESYVSTIIAAMSIGIIVFGQKGLIFPILIAISGILASLISSFAMRIKPGLEEKEFTYQTESVRKAMERSILIANILMIVFVFFLSFLYFKNLSLFWSVLVGLICGMVIAKTTEYYTSEKRKPIFEIAKAAKIGPSNVIMEGLIVGMKSTVLPIVAIAIAVILAYYFGGLYGIALSAVGLLGVLGINLSTDCYGPIADNAAGISEMADLTPQTRQRTEALDAVGNSTAATGKGFAIGAAGLTALAWLVTFSQKSNLEVINLLDPKLLAGFFVGAMLPFLFSALAMKGVSEGALEIVGEVRRQFKEKKLLEGQEKPDYKRAIDLVTKRALREMSFPAILVVVVPIFIGVILGRVAVAGLIVGALGSGFLLALLMANSGAAWDNAKKYIEAGNFGGKGSGAHKSAVIGDTVGDPFKDTAGPSLNILIKLIGVVSLLALPLFL
ncbi:MAG: sodium-translocating pyrophosphatase [Candidatus Pacebacteria bacterium]|nr:sodium-translocating pyrophosphatase [Candidatus Paceibacterota bacterium]